jgi:hypothetical protein
MDMIYMYFIIAFFSTKCIAMDVKVKNLQPQPPKLWSEYPINLQILRLTIQSSITSNVFSQGQAWKIRIEIFKTSGITIKAPVTTHIPNSNSQVMANHKYHYVNGPGKQYFGVLLGR